MNNSLSNPDFIVNTAKSQPVDKRLAKSFIHRYNPTHAPITMRHSEQQPTQDFYHTLNRGVDKRTIFLDKQDYLRFIHDLYELNNEDRVESTFGAFKNDPALANVTKRKQRKLLVDILAFCLMPNHYHLLLAPRVENAIPKFMSKINIGYAKYFNQKYERTGALFQGRYKKILVTENIHFLHLPFYIHFNPLDLSYPEWRDNKISNPKKALEFLESYRWSSHLDYLGIKNFPSVLNMDLLKEIFDGQNGYKKLTNSYLKDIQINSTTTLE
ncbi:MAG: hypothetical protein A3J47_03880 [Candidatus Yanofskybacteria bacterium RIFCSPHIGHO2_02_FULL_43_22]|uniref:Transposase IS200-like domain-containing protein n=2 Tax=Candidatus Yanofskyibacteriota TaxID=1752733 RepID=A0A1F8FMC2_9BACT|nr:MAG: hypothetical protein A3J47_03880 [Candidatus Yanofskybacteria bacterium RIFCSPHIGHO2_02_FULL_43_22]